MATYERVDEDGRVVERVTTPDGSYEDTRLGVAALEGVGGWGAVVEASSEPRVEVPGDRLPPEHPGG